jgi:hypothetical protein
MNFNFLKFSVFVVFMVLFHQSLIAQVAPISATGIFNLSNGNELRLLQAGSEVTVSGNLINPKQKVLAQFKGNYDPSSGRLEGVLYHCGGDEEELLWYFARNTADRAEVYLGPAGKDTKAVASRILGNPHLEFSCQTSKRKVKKIIKKVTQYDSKSGN